MQSIASSDEAISTLEVIVHDPDHKHHMAARIYATERGYGKVTENVNHSGKLSLEQILAESHGQ